MKKHHIILLVILIITLGNLLFLYPKQSSLSIPVEWGPGIDWGRYHIVNEGRIYEGGDYGLTWQSNLKNYGSVDVLPKIHYAILNIITGTVNFPNDLDLHYRFPLVGTLLLPITLLFWYFYLCKKESMKESNYYDYLLLFLFAMFPLASALGPVSGNTNGSGIGRFLFLLILVLTFIIFDEKKKNPKRTFILLILFFVVFNYYHTWSYYVFVHLATIGCITIMKRDERFIFSLLSLGLLLYFASSIYFNFQLFNEPFKMIINFPSILENYPAVSYTAKVSPEYYGYQSLASVYSYMQILGSFFIMLIFLVYLVMYFSRYNDDTHKLYENILSYSIISEFFIGIALFFWNGLLGVAGRFFESFVYVVLLISAYLLVKSDYKIKSIIRFILLCAVITTVVSVQYQPDELKWELTDEEFIGITFAGSHIPNTSYIFSDFRLGPPLIYFNQLGIVTIDSSNNLPTVTEELLDRCYYNVSNPEIILDKIIDSNEYYVMTSFHQTEVFLLDSSLKRFKVVPTDFQKQWTSQKYFNKVYSSWYFNLYQKT